MISGVSLLAGGQMLFVPMTDLLGRIARVRGEEPLASKQVPIAVSRDRYRLRICSERLREAIAQHDLDRWFAMQRLGNGDVDELRVIHHGSAPKLRHPEQTVAACVIYTQNADGVPPIETAHLMRADDLRVTGIVKQYREDNLLLEIDVFKLSAADFAAAPRIAVVSSWVQHLESKS